MSDAKEDLLKNGHQDTHDSIEFEDEESMISFAYSRLKPGDFVIKRDESKHPLKAT
jgi:hypothetical protein